jgi:hypothetical protein
MDAVAVRVVGVSATRGTDNLSRVAVSDFTKAPQTFSVGEAREVRQRELDDFRCAQPLTDRGIQACHFSIHAVASHWTTMLPGRL